MPETSAYKVDTTLSFEQALQELEGIVQTLEQGRAPLEESIQLYEKGAALRQYCEAKLSTAQAKIEKITLSSDKTAENGSVAIEPLDAPSD